MQVRAVRPIRAGEALTVAYVGVMEPRQLRARDLLDSKHFVCACERCTETLADSVDLCLEARSFLCIWGVLQCLHLMRTRQKLWAA